jgi:ACS family hexuronate transporter-like MFS transporter
MFQIRNLRWWIAGLLAAATALSYLDRQNLPVAVVEIQKSIPITDKQYSELTMLFLVAYGVMYAVGGRILDVLGTRLGYAIMIAWWSAATFGHGFVNSVLGLGVARFLVGLGEGGGFPGSAKAVSEWFPPKERSFAFGIFNTGSSIGAVIAPPLIAFIILEFNWRWVFYFTGSLGLVWLVFWWKLYDQPGKHRLITSVEREYLQISRAGALPTSSPHAEAVIPWLELFRYRQTWGLLLSKFLSDSAWFFYIFWLPKYLSDARHLDIKQIGYYAWIPYAFAGAGSFIGGWLSSYLISRNLTIDRSRKITLAMSAALMPVSLLIMASPLSLAIVFFSVAFLGHQFWSTIIQTLAVDIFPSATVGSVAGLMGAAGSLGAMLFSFLVGQLLTYYHSYSLVLTIVGLLHPASFLLILLIVRRIEPLMGCDRKLISRCGQ